MWTYLAIFFSLAVLIGVFVRRVLILRRKKVESKTEGVVEEDFALETDQNKKVSKTDKQKVEELCVRGEALIQAGDDDEAIKCFVQALAIDALHKDTHHKLAMLYLQKQMYSAAAALFKQLAEITQDPIHFSHLGLALYQQSDYESAKGAYQKALDLDPSRPQRFVSLAQVYRALGQFNHALVALTKALEMDEENMDFMFLLADLYVEMKELDKAKEILRQLLSADPELEEAKALWNEVMTLEQGVVKG